MKTRIADRSSGSEPSKAIENSSLEATSTTSDLHCADDQIGQHLADHDLDRRGRHGEQILHRAALGLARQRDRGHHHHRHLQDDAEQAGNDVVLRDAFRIVAPVHHDIELRLRELRRLPPACPARAAAPSAPPCRASRWRRSQPPDRWRRPRSGSAGCRRARSRRAKSAGMVTTKATVPSAISASASAALCVDMVEAVVAGHLQAETMARVTGRCWWRPARPAGSSGRC